MFSDKVVKSDRKGVRTITLQRPEKKNALDAEMFDALTLRLREASADEEVKVVSVEMKYGIIFLLPGGCAHRGRGALLKWE